MYNNIYPQRTRFTTTRKKMKKAKRMQLRVLKKLIKDKAVNNIRFCSVIEFNPKVWKRATAKLKNNLSLIKHLQQLAAWGQSPNLMTLGSGKEPKCFTVINRKRAKPSRRT